MNDEIKTALLADLIDHLLEIYNARGDMPVMLMSECGTWTSPLDSVRLLAEQADGGGEVIATLRFERGGVMCTPILSKEFH